LTHDLGRWVVDFTDPANAQTVGWSDAWSTYWYDGFLYESNIDEGLNIFKLSGNTFAQRIKLGRLNPADTGVLADRTSALLRTPR
jgi:hypothetical protein